MCLLCVNDTLSCETIKTAVSADQKFRHAILRDVLLNGCAKGGQQIVRGLPVADEEATFSTHDENHPF